MKNKISKPFIGIVGALAFFVSSYAFAGNPVSVSTVKVTDTKSVAQTVAKDGWWLLASSNWVLAGPGSAASAVVK